jgi:hypothetical protein
VDKDCALGEGQSKDNSGCGGGGARGGSARWDEFQSKVNSVLRGGGGVFFCRQVILYVPSIVAEQSIVCTYHVQP